MNLEVLQEPVRVRHSVLCLLPMGQVYTVALYSVTMDSLPSFIILMEHMESDGFEFNSSVTELNIKF